MFVPALYRLQATPTAREQGYISLSVIRDNECASVHPLPVDSSLNLLVRCHDHRVTLSAPHSEARIERVGWLETGIALFRRRFTRLSRAVLNYPTLEVFPEGSHAKTRRYCKEIERLRKHSLAMDGEFIREYPEVIIGFSDSLAENDPVIDDKGQRVVVALHLHYFDLWPEIELLLKRWKSNFHLIVTLTSNDQAVTHRIKSTFPFAEVHVVENRGRDVKPFLMLLEGGAFDQYDLICKIHGKRSLGGGRSPVFGSLARRAMYLDLLGSNEQVTAIVGRFAENPSIGVIGPERYLSTFYTAKSKDPIGTLNRSKVESMMHRMNYAYKAGEFDFFAGTMFWIRPGALEPLRRLALASDAFAPEAGLTDVALEHAVERLFNHSARAAGFRVESIAMGCKLAPAQAAYEEAQSGSA